MFKRPQFKELASRISEDRNKLQAMVGPRQVGKSTLVKQVLQETEVPNMMVSADGIPKENTAWIGEVWDTARARMGYGEGQDAAGRTQGISVSDRRGA